MIARKEIVFFIYLVLFLVSCSRKYVITYDTYINGSKEKVNYFIDDKFEFYFVPVHNGVFFTIKNKTDKSAYLIWDRTYFIEPNGNSYKAANTDTLEVEKQISDKEKYESILPPKSQFKRFTTSVININKFKSEYITKVDWNNLSIEKIISTELISVGRFWPIEVREDDLITVTEYIKKNNNMGIGFVIKQGEKEYEYKFDFKFKKAMAIKKVTITHGEIDGESYYEETKWKGIYSAEENEWKWHKIEKE